MTEGMWKTQTCTSWNCARLLLISYITVLNNTTAFTISKSLFLLIWHKGITAGIILQLNPFCTSWVKCMSFHYILNTVFLFYFHNIDHKFCWVRSSNNYRPCERSCLLNYWTWRGNKHIHVSSMVLSYAILIFGGLAV